jgi:hypothetical protein
LRLAPCGKRGAGGGGVGAAQRLQAARGERPWLAACCLLLIVKRAQCPVPSAQRGKGTRYQAALSRGAEKTQATPGPAVFSCPFATCLPLACAMCVLALALALVLVLAPGPRLRVPTRDSMLHAISRCCWLLAVALLSKIKRRPVATDCRKQKPHPRYQWGQLPARSRTLPDCTSAIGCLSRRRRYCENLIGILRTWWEQSRESE